MHFYLLVTRNVQKSLVLFTQNEEFMRHLLLLCATCGFEALCFFWLCVFWGWGVHVGQRTVHTVLTVKTH